MPLWVSMLDGNSFDTSGLERLKHAIVQLDFKLGNAKKMHYFSLNFICVWKYIMLLEKTLKYNLHLLLFATYDWVWLCPS